MSDLRFFKKCRGCAKKRFITRKFELKIKQMGEPMTSKEHFCRTCIKRIRSTLAV